MLERSHHARAFASSLAKELQSARYRTALRSATLLNEHKAIGPLVLDSAKAFAKKVGLHDAVLVDWEGNNARTTKQVHSYPLLGTYTQPDAAVLQPFTCAIEIDRGRTRKEISTFKSCLLKAAAHVLSEAYDACLFVYLATPGIDARVYVDESPHTTQLMQNLQAFGLTVLVPRHRGDDCVQAAA